MSDIVERLRLSVTKGHEPSDQDAIDAADEIERLRVENSCLGDVLDTNERLRTALKQVVADYEDVPDPTDADGQEVFKRARAALEPTPGRKTG